MSCLASKVRVDARVGAIEEVDHMQVVSYERELLDPGWIARVRAVAQTEGLAGGPLP
jgi:hypothetical protein